MKVTLDIWRQPDSSSPGAMVRYELDGISPEMSFLEVLDILNERLTKEGAEPVAFDHDCREGMCGACGVMVNGRAHGPLRRTTVCQLSMRHFPDGATIRVEPWRARAFPVIKDLVVDRSAFDRIIQAGGFVSVNTGNAPEANSVPISKTVADRAFDVAECIGCGACVAQCPNGAGQLFTGAKITHLGLLPQGQPERWDRVEQMVAAMEREGFGGCTNHGECEAVCPRGVSIDAIAQMNRDYLITKFKILKPANLKPPTKLGT